ncbi:MAG: leucine-rich repeat domain-containing protein, partial [Oscillospiraceae bacterium]
EFPSTLKSIGEQAFYGVNSTSYKRNKITSIKFTEGTKSLSIGASAFYSSTSLKSVEMEEGMTNLSVGDNAFQSCTVLTDFKFSKSLDINPDAETQPTMTLGINVFSGSSLATINIPGCLKTLSVNSLGNSNLKYVTLGEGITEIANNGYSGAFPSSLIEVTLPGTLKTIPNNCFGNCTNLKYVNPDKSGETVVNKFPEGLETIGYRAFSSGADACQIEGAVEFPSTLKSIGEQAFYGVNSTSYKRNKITSVKFNEGTESLSIGASAFYGSTSLKSFEFPKSLDITDPDAETQPTLALGSGVFSNCPLETLRIPGCLESLSGSMLSGTSLKYVTLGEGIITIAAGAFPSTLIEVILPGTLKAIPDNCFNGCSSLKYVNKETLEDGTVVNKFPEGLETIGASAFRNSDNACPITGEVVFPSTLKSIGNYAFYAWSLNYRTNKITSIKFTEGTESLTIGNQAFQYSTSLEKFEFPNTLTSTPTLGGSIFYGCSKLTEINIPGCFGTFKNNSIFNGANIQKITLEEGITAVEANAFPNTLVEVILPSTLKAIPNNCFANCSSLKYVNPDKSGETVVNKFPEGLETIGASAFRYGDNACPIEGEVVFPSTLKSIGDYAFYAWSSNYRTNKITSIKFTEGTESLTIGNQAFQYSTSLEKFEFPNTLTSTPTLGGSIFYGCSKLTEINIPGCFGTFKNNSIFNGANIQKITLEEGITAVEANAFPNTLVEVILPSTLKAIPNNCFANCSSLKYVNPDKSGETVVNKFPEGLETIGASAFRSGDNSCPITGEVIFPSTLKSIGDHAFYAWSGNYRTNKITSITFTEGTEELSIGSYAFQYSTSLKELNLSDNIISIGDYAFNGINQLSGSDLNLPKNLNNLGATPFGSAKFKRIYTPLHPYHCYNSKLYGEEVHFRGIDADETATEGTASGYHWGCFYNWCTLVDNSKLYIEPTVKHLTNVKNHSDNNGGNMNFWDKFSEINFVGENVINIDKSNGAVFSAKEQPLNNLSGMYYVTEEG